MTPDARADPVVVKVGGGLLRDAGLDGLRRACADVRAIAAARPVLVVPGGGPFADAVRVVDAEHGLGDALAHELALAAMDQLGVLLGELLGEGEPLHTLVAPRGVAILRARAALADRDDVPRAWTVTSDSIAVLAAAAVGASQAVLLKPVAGVYARWPSDGPVLPALTADGLQALQEGGGGRVVDAYLPEAVRRTGVTVTVRLPASRPGGEVAAGTRITPG